MSGDPYRVAQPPAQETAIRAIRIASVAIERIEAIVGGGNGNSQEELELQIGEMQMLYPEIWRHLDEAREVLAARAVDVSAYDAIRAREGKGNLAVDDVETERRLGLGLGGVRYVETRKATINWAGLTRAKQAIATLEQAMPEVDWRALERAEAQEIASFGRLRPSGAKLALIGVLALAGLVWLALR